MAGGLGEGERRTSTDMRSVLGMKVRWPGNDISEGEGEGEGEGNGKGKGKGQGKT